MQQAITEQLEELVKLRHEPAEEVIAEALQLGMSRLYVESVLKQYLKRQIYRSKAIQLVGIEAVKLAEEQQRIVRKDIVWGLKNG